MNRPLLVLILLVVRSSELDSAAQAPDISPPGPPPFDAPGRPNQSRPGPWDNDVVVYHVSRDGPAQRLATFGRAGVPTAARLKDGRLMVAHQHFPENNDADFDKVAVRFSSDEGRTWTEPETVRLRGIPEGMRFPFDPTLVPLPDGRVRLYFTSVKGRRLDEHRPAIYSAVSSNAVDFEVEPGARFEVEDRPVIDCAVVLHEGQFHLFAPDNGAGPPPGARSPVQGGRTERPRPGIGYHATSQDGLKFTRQPDVQMDGRRRWLGNAQSDGAVIRFFGTGDPGGPGSRGGVWAASSSDGQSWQLQEDFAPVPGADPGAVQLRDGTWLLVATGPPRPGTPSAQRRRGQAEGARPEIR